MPPLSMTELQDIIFHAPAWLKLDLILRGHRLVAKLRSLARVPCSRRARAIDRLVIRSNARYQPVFARRDISEREGAVATDNRFGVAQHFIGSVRPGRDQMRAQSSRQSLARLFGDDLAAQARRAFGDGQRDAGEFLALFERKPIERNVIDRRRRASSRWGVRRRGDRLHVKVFVVQRHSDSVMAGVNTVDRELAFFIRAGHGKTSPWRNYRAVSRQIVSHRADAELFQPWFSFFATALRHTFDDDASADRP